MALSTMLQGEDDAASATRLFLPLAERMLKKTLNDGHFTSHDDFSVYLSVLLRLNKFEEILTLLNDDKLIGLLNTLDYDHDYNPLLLKVNSQLNNWAEMVKISENLLNVDADNWFAWESLLRHCFDDENLRENVLELIEKYSKTSPKSRGPRLAMMDFSANLIKRGIKHPKSEDNFCVRLIKDYFRDFCRKPVGSLDLAFVIPLLVKSDAARISLVKSLLEEAKAYQNFPNLSVDDKVHSEVCAFRLARTNGVRIDPKELIITYQTRAMVPLPKEKDVTKETIAYDDLLQLAVSELLDPATVDKTTKRGLGCILLGAYWLSDIGLKRSPANHFMRLKLAAMLSPFGGLACVGRLLQELKSLNLKETLYISICHVAMAPGPFLAAFGERSLVGISSKSDQQYANLISFYEGTIKRIQGIQHEMENCLMRSYRRNAFGSIHETTQFLQMLGRTDVFVLAQTELIYNKVLVKCDCFDDVLEQMGACSSELTQLGEALGNICDNRDFSVVPEFYHTIPDANNRKTSFDHLNSFDIFNREPSPCIAVKKSNPGLMNHLLLITAHRFTISVHHFYNSWVNPPDTSSISDTLNPSSVLVGLAVAFETFSLALIFATSAVAMLRPRSLAYNQSMNKLSKKNKKKQEKSNEAEAQKVVTSPVAKLFDQAAVVIRTSLMPQLQQVAAKLQELSQSWADWSSEKAAKAFTATAEETARATLTTTIEADEAFPWSPTSSSDILPSIYKDIASDLTCGFTELAESFSRKTTALNNALFEVHCFANLKITNDK
nr:hypothetical transcript [Hymenolepis microstoma]